MIKNQSISANPERVKPRPSPAAPTNQPKSLADKGSELVGSGQLGQAGQGSNAAETAGAGRESGVGLVGKGHADLEKGRIGKG